MKKPNSEDPELALYQLNFYLSRIILGLISLLKYKNNIALLLKIYILKSSELLLLVRFITAFTIA